MTNPVRARRRSTRLVATAAVIGLASSAIVAAGGGTAAAADLPQAQSVGNFLDATVGGMTLDQLAKLDYAKAKAPGSASVQNPLDVTALGALNLPLTGALQLPQLLGIGLGAVTQKAQANVNGSSYGQAGAVKDSGGASVGGSDSSGQAGSAKINLTAAGLAGNSPIPLPGGTGSLAALGGVTASIDGVSSLASTPVGYDKGASTSYAIADVNLTLGSPLLGGVLGQVTTGAGTVTTALAPVLTALSALGTVPAGCALTGGGLPSTISLDNNGVTGVATVDAATGTITLSVDKLLKSLGLNLNDLPANTDLVKFITDNLGNILAKGIGGLINALVTTLGGLVASCTPAGVLGTGLQTLLGTLTTTVSTATGQLGTALNTVTSQLTPLTDALKNLLDIGVNVQPNGKAGTYTDPLAATPKQGTDVVDGQTIVRAIELNIAGAAGGSGLLSLALANSAAGPSAAPVVTTPSTTVPTSSVPSTNIPTGVPAGAAGEHGGGLPVLPLVALLMLLSVAGGSYWHLRIRGNHL